MIAVAPLFFFIARNSTTDFNNNSANNFPHKFISFRRDFSTPNHQVMKFSFLKKVLVICVDISAEVH